MRKLVLILGLSFILSFSADASEYIPCGESEAGSCWSCGDTCSARLTYSNETDAINQTNATLTFSGTGEMKDYGSPFSDDPSTVAPWYNLRDSIAKVVVDEGITSIGARTIYQMGNIDLNLPESLNKINSYAFYISHISTLNIPSNVTFLAPSAFGSGSQYNESTYLNNLICDEALKSQCEAMLSSWDKNISLTISEQHNGQYYLNGKFYNSVNDMMHGNYIKKRIYTIDEANTVTGPVNRISIKYR